GGTAASGSTTAATATTTTGGTSGGKKYSIGILQTSTHPALDFTREGIKQAFIQAGMVEGKTVTFDVRNAELDAPTAAKMADAFIANKMDAIVTIGSPATAAALNETKKAGSSIPIFFSAVADPYGPGFAGKKEGDTLTADPHLHPANMTGVQAFPPVEEGMKLILEVKPGIKTVGLLWNPSEPNSSATTTEARRVAATLGISLIDRSAIKPADTLDAANTLAQHGAEAFFVSTTNSVVNGLDSVVRVAQENSVPLFGNDPLSASRGAVAAQGLDYTQNGLEAGQMAVQVLTGKATIKSLDVQKTTKESLCINTKAAELQKVTLPAALIARAKGCTYTEIKTPLPPAPAAGTMPPITPAPVGTPVPAGKTP
ncbi:MAG: ABC transporter substrate-binding protein, partial [Chloroflexota bacterium]|nr:ABC transporter substrate-binding protein [Chloroflexota bacterium]